MKRSLGKILALLLAMVVMTVTGIATAGSVSAKPRPAADVSTVPITGTLADGTGSVDGVFDVQRFANQNGTLTAIGTFSGTITDEAGAVLASTGTGTVPLALPVDLQQSEGSCQVLDLVLGPLNLDLLGLEVFLDTVHLNITAQQGPGNLLGNLLCAVAGLLNGPTGVNAVLNQIAKLLNRLLGILG